MSFQPMIQRLKRGDLQAVYTVAGTEFYLKEQFQHTLISQFDEADVEIVTLDLDEVTFETVLEEADSFSFFAPTRIIVVEGVQITSSAGASQLTKENLVAFDAYLQNPNPQTILVLNIPHDDVDRRRRVTKLLQNHTAWVDVTPLKEGEVRRFIHAHLRASQMEITRDALDELLLRTDFELSKAVNELVKLEQAGQTIDIDVVRTLVSRTLETDVFELTNAVVAGQLARATQIYEDLLLMNHNPIQLHGLITSQFRIILQAKLLNQQGLMEQEIARHLKVHPYRVKLALQSGRHLSLSKLAQFYDELIETDFKMKQGIGVQTVYFDILLSKMTTL